jgi:serine/threonine-protein kinase
VGGTDEEDFFAPGTVLDGKFEVRHKIGEGAMGTVYLARDVSLKRDVAVKTLSRTYRDRELVRQFREEAESMARVQHPNVVQIFSYGEEAGIPYFVMELVDGETLADAIDRRELDGELVHVDEALGIISQVCRGLSAIHARGIVHRDVKPANIMITTDYRVALTDFGLVGRIADETNKGMEVHGTPVYLAPERIDTRPVLAEHAHLCDIYALGIVLYEFLTLYVPFDHDDLMALLNLHLHEPPPRPSRYRPDLPAAIEGVILRALAKDPGERYESAEAFRRALLDARESGLGAVGSGGIDELTMVVVQSSTQEVIKTLRAVKKAFPGATALSTSDGKTGLDLVRELRPDIVLMDSECERLNALEMVASLQGEELLEATRMLVLSGKADGLEQQYLKDLGVAEVLTKPISGAALVRAIRQASTSL